MESIKLDGREFNGITQSLSASQDDYILGHLRAAGALEIIGDLDRTTKRTPRKRAEDLLTAVMLAGRTHHVIAGCLTEQGKKWTREEADRNAARFAELTDDEEKQGMRVAIARFVIQRLFREDPDPDIAHASVLAEHGRDGCATCPGTLWIG